MSNKLYECWNKNAGTTELDNSYAIIMKPIFNIRGMINEMALLEDHLNIPVQNCQDCISEHLIKCEAFVAEATILDSGESEIITMLPETIRRWSAAWIAGVDKHRLAAEIRKSRKSLMNPVMQYSRYALEKGVPLNEIKKELQSLKIINS
jgi:hypothetical protein